MLNHDFSKHSGRELIELKSNLKATLKNPACEPIHDNYRMVIAFIEIEQELRGIGKLIKQKQAA